MKLIKKNLFLIICIIILGLCLYYVDDISNYISRSLEKNPSVIAPNGNTYKIPMISSPLVITIF